MAGYRKDRVAEDIKREIVALIRELKDPRVKDKMLTVVRVEVGKRLRLRKAPELKFAADDSVEHGMEIFRKIEALKKDDEEDK